MKKIKIYKNKIQIIIKRKIKYNPNNNIFLILNIGMS